MHIEFAPVDEKYIKESVKNGYFKSEAEAVRYAVRAAREQAEEKKLRLLQALKLGEDDVAAGRVTRYTSELFDQIMEEAKIHAAEGRKPKSDVIP